MGGARAGVETLAGKSSGHGTPHAAEPSHAPPGGGGGGALQAPAPAAVAGRRGRTLRVAAAAGMSGGALCLVAELVLGLAGPAAAAWQMEAARPHSRACVCCCRLLQGVE